MKKILLITSMFVCTNAIIDGMENEKQKLITLSKLQIEFGSITKVRYNPDGSLIAVASVELLDHFNSYLNIIKQTDDCQKKIATLTTHQRNIKSIDWNPQNKNQLAYGDPNGIKILDIGNNNKLRLTATLKALYSSACPVKFIPCHSLLATSDNKMIKLYDLRSRKVSIKLEGYKSFGAGCLDCSSDGNQLASAGTYENDPVKAWDLRNPKQCNFKTFPTEGLRSYFNFVYYNPLNSQNMTTVGTWTPIMAIFDTETRKLIKRRPYFKGRGQCSDMRYSPSGKLIASIHCSGLLNIWEPQINKNHIIKVDNDSTALDFSPTQDNKLTVGDYNGSIVTYKLNE